MNVKYSDYHRLHVTRKADRLKRPVVSLPEAVTLPTNSAIHYIAESGEIGISKTHSLMRNMPDRVLSYHIEELDVVTGKPMPVRLSVSKIVRQYHRSHLTMRHTRDLEVANANVRTPLVVSYGLLPMLNKYSTTRLQTYQEWRNIRNTMWNTIIRMGSDRHHFIVFKLPEFLPSRKELELHAESFTTRSLENFHTPEAMDLLELWGMLEDDTVGVDDAIPADMLKDITLVFSESGQLVNIRLSDLLSWRDADSGSTMRSMYRLLELVLELRTIVNTTDLESEVTLDPTDEHVTGSDVINRLIAEATNVGELSGSEAKALVKLSERYKKIENPHGGSQTLDQMVVTPKDLTLSDNVVASDSITVHDKSILRSRVNSMDSLYVDKVMHNDIMQSMLMVQNAGLIVKDVKVKRKNTAVTKSDTYSLQIQPVGGNATTVKFTLPVVDSNGVFFVNNTKYRLDKQRGDLPFVKTKPFTVALTSYYGKNFIVRNQNNSTNWAKWIQKHLSLRGNNSEDNTVTDLTYGSSFTKGVTLPRQYTAIAENIGTFKAKGITWYWNYGNIADNFTEADISKVKKMDSNAVLVGKGSKLVYMNMDNDLFAVTAKGTDLIGSLTTYIDPDMGTGPSEYCELNIFNKRLPLVLALSYITGLDRMLKRVGIPYTTVPAGARTVNDPSVYRMRFKDITYVVDVRDPSHSLLMNGFNAIRKSIRRHSVATFNKRHGYTSLLSNLGLTAYHLREVELMFDMFIDPITMELLKTHDLPTTVEGLLLKANTALLNDMVPEYEEYRIKGYERMSGMLYTELINSIRGYRSQGRSPNAELTMNPNAVLLNIVQDQSIALVEDSSPMHNIREHSVVTFAGHGGRSAVSMNKESRVFTKKDIGVISESTPDSSKVGIRSYLSANPNLTNLRGEVSRYNPDTDSPHNLLSTSAMVSTNATNDDAKRVNFIGIQHSQGVSCDSYHAAPYRTGTEQVIANLVDPIFANTAKTKGKVTNIDDSNITIALSDGTEQIMPLGKQFGKVSGVTVPHMLVTDLKIGDSVKANDVVSYNTGYFERDLLNPDGVVLKNGRTSRVALLESSYTLEDGCTVSKELADVFTTPTTYVRNINIDFNTAIHDLVKVGDSLDPDSILCTLEEAVTADVSKETDTAIDALKGIAASNPKSKHYGTISKIEVLYFGKIEDMSESISAIVRKDNSRRAKLSKSGGGVDATTGEVDQNLIINGNKLTVGNLVVSIYIDSEISLGTGDKLVFGNFLKTTISAVESDSMSTESGDVVEATFGYESVAARIALSPEIAGTMNRVLEAMSLELVNNYRG